MQKRITWVTAITIGLLFFQSIGKTDDQVETRKKAKMLEIAMSALPKTADPRELWNFQHFLLVQSIYQSLVRVSESGKLVADLSTRWEIDRSGKVYTFYLNEKALFQNGQPVTSQDVALSLARHLWPNSPSVIQNYLKDTLVGANNLKTGAIPGGITTPSDHVVRLTLTNPYPPFLFVLAMPGFSIVPAGLAQTPKGEWIGSGPMSARWNSDTSRWTLTLFDKYSGSRVPTHEIRLRQTANFQETQDLVRKNEIDVAIGIPISDAAENLNLPGFQVTKTNSLVYSHLFFNHKSQLFHSHDLRKDLGQFIQSLAKKPEHLTEFLTYEPYYLPKGIMPPSYYQRQDHSLSADELRNKWHREIAGKRLHVVVLKNYYNKRMLDDLETTLKALGFEVTFDRVLVTDYFAILKNGDYDMITGSYVGNFPDPDGFLDPLKEGAQIHFGLGPSRKLFQQIEKARYMVPAEKRLEEYSKILRQYEDEWNFIPMYRVSMPMIHNSKVSIPDTNFRYEAELWNMFWKP